MVQLLIVAHAPLATALQQVAWHTYPELAHRVHALDVAAGDAPELVESRLRAMLPALGETLVMTDVFGATPCAMAMKVADGIHTRVVAGVNVPMLWRALCYCSVQPLNQLVGMAVSGASHGVMQLATTRPQNQSPKGTHDDSGDAQDQ